MLFFPNRSHEKDFFVDGQKSCCLNFYGISMSSISAFLVLACLSNVGEVASLAIPFADVVFGLCDRFSKFQSAQQRFQSLSFSESNSYTLFLELSFQILRESWHKR